MERAIEVYQEMFGEHTIKKNQYGAVYVCVSCADKSKEEYRNLRKSVIHKLRGSIIGVLPCSRSCQCIDVRVE